MDSLIPDLRTLIDKHLQTLEDVFINHQDHTKLKNIKKAVKLKNWNSIIYFLQRYRYQQSIISEAHCAAIGYRYRDLQKLFNIQTPVAYDFVYSIAKGKYYKTLDEFINASIKYTYDYRYAMTTGFIANNDIAAIKSGQYEHPRNLTSDMFKKLSRSSKKIEIIEYYRELELFKPYMDVECRIISGLQIDEKDINLNDYPYPDREHVIINLVKRGYTELIEKIIYQRNDSLEKFAFLEGLVKANRHAKVDEFFSRSGCGYEGIRSTICKAAVDIDNLQLFIRYFDPNQDYLHILFDDAVRNESYCVLKHILEHNYCTDIEIHKSICVEDPKVAELLVKHNIKIELDKNRYVQSRFNIAYEILSK